VDTTGVSCDRVYYRSLWDQDPWSVGYSRYFTSPRIRELLSTMTTETPEPQAAGDIPSDDCPCRVDWQDRFSADIPHSKTDTTWLVYDEMDNPTTVVTIEPDLGDSDEETGVCTFHASDGLFRLIAQTPSGDVTIEARSILYKIVPGAPAVGIITLTPV